MSKSVHISIQYQAKTQYKICYNDRIYNEALLHHIRDPYRDSIVYHMNNNDMMTKNKGSK